MILFSFLCRNSVNVEGAEHRKVVDLIRQGGDELSLVVVSCTPSEARKLDGPPESVGSPEFYDYTDRRSIPVTIPDTRLEEKFGEKFVVRD